MSPYEFNKQNRSSTIQLVTEKQRVDAAQKLSMAVSALLEPDHSGFVDVGAALWGISEALETLDLDVELESPGFGEPAFLTAKLPSPFTP